MDSLAPTIQVGPATITVFSLIWITAIAVAAAYAAFRASKAGLDTLTVLDTLVWMSLASLIVARIFYILNPPPSTSSLYTREWYLAHPLDLQVGVLAVWSGGLGAAGALLGGIVAGAWHLGRRSESVWEWADIFAPPLLLGLAIGPWANIVNQQLYGPTTNLPWGIAIVRPVFPYAATMKFHPTPAYISIWTFLCLVIVLLLEARGDERQGIVFVVGLVSYLTGLFLADWVRLDVNHGLLGLTGTQWLAMALILLCLAKYSRLLVFGIPDLTGNIESGK